MKEKIVTEQNIARFEKELKKSEKTPNTIHKYVCDMLTEEVSPET